MPLERSTFVLFSPKLVIPDPTFHHFVLPVPRRQVDTRLQQQQQHDAQAFPFPKSPRVAVVSPRGDAVEGPDLAADDQVLLYGCSLVEWAPAGDEVLLPRCLTLVSTEPRFESLRAALLAMRGAQAGAGGLPMTPVGSSPLTPGTPKKTPWQVEDETTRRRTEGGAAAAASSSSSSSWALLDAAVLDQRVGHGDAPKPAEAVRYWRQAAQGQLGPAAAAGGPGNCGTVPAGLLSPTAKAGAAGSTGLLSPTAASRVATGGAPAASGPTSQAARLPPPLLRALPAPVDVSYVPLFHALSPETLLRALTAVLLERPVVVQSASRTLAVLACEALRRLIHPFAWLRPYMPLLPVAGVCALWDEVKRSGGGQTWFDYVFEDDGLDDSLVAAAAGEVYVVSTS